MRNRAKDSEICVQCKKDFLKKTDIVTQQTSAEKDSIEEEKEKKEAAEKAKALARLEEERALARLEEERQAILKKRRDEQEIAKRAQMIED